MSTFTRPPNPSDDEFESADEGDPTSASTKKPVITDNQVQSTSSTAVTDGWGDWNIDDEPTIETVTTKASHPPFVQQDSVSSVSSSSPSKAESSSRLGSDEEDPADLSDQQRLQRKKLRKKPLESNVRSSRPLERRDDDPVVHGRNVQDTHHLLDRLAAQSPTRAPSWSTPWSNFGSFLSTAKQSVTTLTSTVSEGFSAVIESVEAGLGAPDPHQLAEMNRMAFRIKGETSESEEEPETALNQAEENDSVTNQDGWLNALSLDQLTTTGMKVVSGSLDVLESVGKKTFDVISEADPDLQGTRRLLGKQSCSTLSDIVRERQHEKENKSTETKKENLTFFQLFEQYHGLAHYEALEALSNQSSMVLQTMIHGNENLLEQISTYFQVDDDDELTLNSLNINDQHDSDIPTLDVLSQKFTAYQTQLRSVVSTEKLLEAYESAHQCLKGWEWMDTEDDQKTLTEEAIDCLALLSASMIEYYRKTAELFLTGCKSLTSFSIDIELLAIYRKQQGDFSQMLNGIPTLFARRMKQTSALPSDTSDPPVRCDAKLKQRLLNQMFIQSSSSQTYASDAYTLLKPIFSQSIVFHRSTTITTR